VWGLDWKVVGCECEVVGCCWFVRVRKPLYRSKICNASEFYFFLSLRVKILLKTDNWYPKDSGVTLLTLETPGNPLRYNVHRSLPPRSSTSLFYGVVDYPFLDFLPYIPISPFFLSFFLWVENPKTITGLSGW